MQPTKLAINALDSFSQDRSPNRIPPLVEGDSSRIGGFDALTERHCTIVYGSKRVLAVGDTINRLRAQVGQSDDATSDVRWFVNTTLALSYRPWVVLLFERQRLVAALLLAERRFRGVPIGYLKAEGMDQGFLICRPEARTFYMTLMLNGIFTSSSVSVVQISQLDNADTAFCIPADLSWLKAGWKEGQYHYRVSLQKTIDDTLSGYGPHTRRNIRYVLRRAKKEGCTFFAELTDQQRHSAVQELVQHATHKISVESAQLREVALKVVANAFAMGLQDLRGDWLSYMTGWREGERTLVYWQMNRSNDDGMSIGTAMRSFFLEKEFERGATEIVFLGGSSGIFKRCCHVEKSVHLIVQRKSLRAEILMRVLNRVVVPGHPLKNDVQAL